MIHRYELMGSLILTLSAFQTVAKTYRCIGKEIHVIKEFKCGNWYENMYVQLSYVGKCLQCIQMKTKRIERWALHRIEFKFCCRKKFRRKFRIFCAKHSRDFVGFYSFRDLVVFCMLNIYSVHLFLWWLVVVVVVDSVHLFICFCWYLYLF